MRCFNFNLNVISSFLFTTQTFPSHLLLQIGPQRNSTEFKISVCDIFLEISSIVIDNGACRFLLINECAQKSNFWCSTESKSQNLSVINGDNRTNF